MARGCPLRSHVPRCHHATCRPTSPVAAFMCAGLSGAVGITIPLENEEEKERRDRTARMQAGKNAMASVKETAGNVAASAKAGMDKTTATVQEKVSLLSHRTTNMDLWHM